MLARNHALATYAAVKAETDVACADPHQLVLMLFDAALVAVHRADERMRVRDMATKGTAVSKAIQIIEEGLIASLDMQAGGTLAERLRGLYQYMTRRLLFASVKNDPSGLEEVATLLADLKQAWAAIPPANRSGNRA